jgi:hypothetical protein
MLVGVHMVSNGAKIGGAELSVERNVAAWEPKNGRRGEIDSAVRADRIFDNIRFVCFTACYYFHCTPQDGVCYSLPVNCSKNGAGK